MLRLREQSLNHGGSREIFTSHVVSHPGILRHGFN